jgi:hydroxymethylpyrimidine pyrophosphatase-like HAD family hydrolase
MEDAHQELFSKLAHIADIVIATGGTLEHIKHQATERFSGTYHALAQSGNHCTLADGTELWYEPLTPDQETHILSFVEVLKKHFAHVPKDESDLVDRRGAQIGYSVIGYHEDIAKKYAFDPGDVKRREALATHAGHVTHLKSVGVEVVPAGTTGYNFIPLGKHKGHNVRRLCTHMGWNPDDCLYIGDALFPGGNDEAVIGVIPTHAVKDHHETFEYLESLLDTK